MRKIGIAMPCYDREAQLRVTLERMAQSKHTDYHLVVVDDASPTPLSPSLLSNLPATLISVTSQEKKWINPLIPTNMAILHLLKHHAPDIVIIQCAECYYVGDVLSYAAAHITDENYISFGCVSLERPGTFTEAEIRAIRKGTQKVKWYNHPKYNKRGLEFCSATSTRAMRSLNGHDERFKDAMGRADHDLVRRAKRLGLDFIITDYPFVVHQHHSRHYRRTFPTNNALYERIKKEENYRAVHLITEDFPP